MSEHTAAEIDPPVEQKFNTCPRCGQPVPAPFKAHIDNLGGCPESRVTSPDKPQEAS